MDYVEKGTGLPYIFSVPTGEDTSGWKIFLEKCKKPLYKSKQVCYYTNANDNC